MYSVKTSTYADLLRRTYAIKSPLYVYGGPGIGKSEIPRQVFQDIASNEGSHTRQDEINIFGGELGKKDKPTDTVKGRVFLQWNHLNLDQKMVCIKNPEPYFIFCDQRVAQMDTTDLRGIPNMVNSDMLETIPMSWVIYFTQKNAHGAIFFDELNLAAPAVAGQAYQIINEREIADRKIGADVYVFGAGNRQIDQANVFTMSFPLRDRFNEVEIYPDVKDWTVNYATGKVNPHLIAFVNWKESYLYHVDKNSANKSSTPRGIKRASDLIGDLDILSSEVHQYVSIAVGEGFATQFQAYCKHFQSLDWKQIYKNPKIVSEFEVDKLWAVIGGMGEQFTRDDMKQEIFDKIVQVVLNMKTDFAVVTLKMLRDFDGKKFGKMLNKSPEIEEVVEKYAKYVIG